MDALVQFQLSRLDPPKTWQPELRGNNLAVQSTRERFVILSGPAGTGKSTAALWLIHHDAEAYPGSRQLILRKTRESITQSALVTFEQRVLPPGHPVLYGRGGGTILRGNRSEYTYENGSSIVIGGMDKPEKLFSTEYDRIYIQEITELSFDDVQTLFRALRHGAMPFQQIIGDCNPGPPTHWIKQNEIRQLEDGSAVGSIRLLETTHRDNPEYWDAAHECWTAAGKAYVEGMLSKLSGVLRDRLYLGLWVAAEGIVYDDFAKSVHVIPRFPIPPDWRRVLSVDFGFTHPMSAELWALDGDGRMYLDREVYRTGLDSVARAKKIREMLRKSGVSDSGFEGVGDSEDPGAIADLGREGINLIPVAKWPGSVNTGIMAVKKRLAVQADGKPRLFVFDDTLMERDEAQAAMHRPTCLLDEMELSVWKKDRTGRLLDEPLMENDDGASSLRYCVAYVDKLTADNPGGGWWDLVKKHQAAGALVSAPEPPAVIVGDVVVPEPPAPPAAATESEDAWMKRWSSPTEASDPRSPALREVTRINEEIEKARQAKVVAGHTMRTHVVCRCGEAWDQGHAPSDVRVVCRGCGTICSLLPAG